MIIENNFFSSSLLSSLVDDYRISLKGYTARISRSSWSPTVRNLCVSGIEIRPVDSLLGRLVEQRFSEFFLKLGHDIRWKTGSLDIHYYTWPPGSSISVHSDHIYQFGATVYLNTHWSADQGGLFVWQEYPEDQIWQALVPEYNVMVINLGQQNHLVTPISQLSPEDRVTLQVFCP